MIIFLPALYFWAKFLYKYWTECKMKNILHNTKCDEINCNKVDLEYDLKFDPPVYKLRYSAVEDVLLIESNVGQIKKIVEYGCAEMKFLDYIKPLFGIKEVILVDIDEYVLRENLFRVCPQNVDFLDRRSEALQVSVFAGSISDPDCNLINTDAVIGIEM